MMVKKRSGEFAPLDITNIRKQTVPSCDGLGLSYEDLELSSGISFFDGMSTTDIQNILINTADNKIDIDDPNWTYVAARLRLYDIYHVIKREYNKSTNGDVYNLVTLHDYIEKNKAILAFSYSKDEINELQKSIDSSKDLLFTSLGIKTLRQRYLIKKNETITELPQHLFMGLAMWLASVEVDKVKLAKLFYNMFSSFEVFMATPTLSKGRIKNQTHASCFFGTTPDDIDGIFDTYKVQAKISKNGGGIGWDWSRIRALGGIIQNIKNAAGGIVPWMKIENDVAIAVDQLGVRQGAIAVYTETSTLDIFDFLDLKKSSGEERRRAEDLFLAISASDIFMERIEQNGLWTLFDPYDTPDLNELYGEAYTAKYIEYEKLFKYNPESFTNKPRVIEAVELARTLVTYYFETGGPFWLFKDNANRNHRQKHLGIIRSSNLCTEQLQAVSGDEIAVCNLASVNLARVKTPERMEEVTALAIRALDNVVSLSNYPEERSKKTQESRRAIGLGTMGEAEAIANLQIMYGSTEHEAYIDEYYGILENVAYKTSRELAKEKGACQADPTQRNAYLLNGAPTSTISIIAGTTACHEPVFGRKWSEGSGIDKTTVTAPNITTENYSFYPTAYEVDQFVALKMTSLRQKKMDMGISHNIYLRPDNTSGKEILDLIMYAWKLNVNTLYYLRSDNAEADTSMTDAISCVGCQ